MKKITKSFLLTSILLVVTVVLGYLLLAFYYRDGFCLNTWINGVYCTGKTVEDVNAELLAKAEAPIVVITDKKGDSYTIDLAQVGYKEDFLPTLNQYMEAQNPLLWIDNVTFHRNHELAPAISYDEEMLRAAFEELFFVKNEKQRPSDYLLIRNWTDGYLIYDGLSGRLDVDKAFVELQTAIDNKVYQVDFADADVYYDMPMTAEQKEIHKLWQKIEAYQNCDLVYDMGDCQIPFTPVIMSDFLQTENGELVLDTKDNLVLNEDAIEKFVADLAEEYDTYGKEREFQSTRGDKVTVVGGTYGTEIDQNAEITFLTENLFSEEIRTGTKQLHIPFYKREAMVRGKDDIGQTYIEIDMTEQKMYYYQDGELKLETEVVTGNISRHWNTPEGINYIYNKQQNRILRGANYASFVKYWMPVKGNYGIHDASWRSKFGGTIYQKNGSHGCINTPSEKMEELYEMVEIGTPVIMFY